MHFFRNSQITRRLLTAVAAATACVSFLNIRNSPSLVLRSTMHDHISQLSSAAVLPCEGSNIFRTPPSQTFQLAENHPSLGASQLKELDFFKRELNVKPNELFFAPECSSRILQFVWPFIPRPYGPSFYAMILPISLAWSNSVVNLQFALTLILFLMATFATYSIFLFQDIFNSTSKVSSWFANVLVFFYSLEAIRWALSGQFECVSVFFLLLALRNYQQKKFANCLVFMGITLSFQFRAFFWIPLVVFCIVEILRAKKFSILKALTIRKVWLALAFSTLGLYSFLLSFAHLNSIKSQFITNNVYWLSPKYPLELLGLLTVGLGFGSWLLVQKKFLPACQILWLLGMLTTMPFVKPWHILFIIPLLALPILKPNDTFSKTEWALISLFYVLASMSVFNNSPFEFNLIREVLSSTS